MNSLSSNDHLNSNQNSQSQISTVKKRSRHQIIASFKVWDSSSEGKQSNSDKPYNSNNNLGSQSQIKNDSTAAISVLNSNPLGQYWRLELEDKDAVPELGPHQEILEKMLKNYVMDIPGIWLLNFKEPCRKKYIERLIPGVKSLEKISDTGYAMLASQQNYNIFQRQSLIRSQDSQITNAFKDLTAAMDQMQIESETIVLESHCRSCGELISLQKFFCEHCGLFIPSGASLAKREHIYREKAFCDPSDIHEDLRKNEYINRVYNPCSPHIKYRKVLIDLIHNYAKKMKLETHTIHMAVSYLDAYFAQEIQVQKTEMQLISLGCLVIASKFCEDSYFTTKEYHYSLKPIYSCTSLVDIEIKIVQSLGWDLRSRTPYEFLHFYLSRGCVFSTDKTLVRKMDHNLLRYLRKFSEFILDMSLNDYEFNKYQSHVVAASAIACARKALGIIPHWNRELEELTQTNWMNISECYEDLYNYLEVKHPEIAIKINELCPNS